MKKVMRITKGNGEPMWSDKSLIKNPSTRLRFSIWVIVANFILGIVGMVLGADLTALGVFLGLANAPLYAYILGRSFRPEQNGIPENYFNQAHGGAGGLGTIINPNNQFGQWGSTSMSTTWGSGGSITPQKPDEFNNPNYPQSNEPLPTTNKPKSEIG